MRTLSSAAGTSQGSKWASCPRLAAIDNSACMRAVACVLRASRTSGLPTPATSMAIAPERDELRQSASTQAR